MDYFSTKKEIGDYMVIDYENTPNLLKYIKLNSSFCGGKSKKTKKFSKKAKRTQRRIKIKRKKRKETKNKKRDKKRKETKN